MRESVISLRSPIQIRLVDAYGNWTQGFLWWASLDDFKGNWTQVCLDSRKASPTRNRLFEGAKHPSKSGAQLVEFGSVEEGIIISLLSNWLDSPDERWLRHEAREQMRLDLFYYGDEPSVISGP